VPSDLRESWRAGRATFGAWSTTGSPLPAELLGLCGFDWVCVDLQHGLGGLENLAPSLQAISVTGAVPLVRVPANEPWIVMRALDLGAAGVVVPLVSSPDEAERAAAACRYPPEGTRSWGPVRRSADRPGVPLCLPMIETRDGVESLHLICAVPGVDGVYVGPRDLALSHGLEPGQALDALIERIVATCREHGVPAGIHTRSGESARAYAEAGFLFAAVASDRDLLARAATAELTAARGGEPPQARRPEDGLLRANVSYAST
jgi:4-hydroxy-2-oxoheptanedioate aldolase